MPHPMNDDEARAFLGEGTRTGKLATTRPDGRPHVAPIWFILDGDDVVFMTGAKTVKGRNIAHNANVALSADLEEPPYAFVLVEGTAHTSTDLEAMLPLSIKIAKRYMGDDKGEEFGRRNAVEGELLVRLTPSKVTGVAGLAD